MPGCGMHSRPKLAEKARYNSLLKNKSKQQKYLKFLHVIFHKKPVCKQPFTTRKELGNLNKQHIENLPGST